MKKIVAITLFSFLVSMSPAKAFELRDLSNLVSITRNIIETVSYYVPKPPVRGFPFPFPHHGHKQLPPVNPNTIPIYY